MTEKLEIRAKSIELAVKLLGVLTIPSKEVIDVNAAMLYLNSIESLALSFEELILKAAQG
jgi:hypothetical protein